jgi:hypothetical protein
MARKFRTVLPVRALNGEKLVFTAVIYLVSMIAGDFRSRRTISECQCSIRS